MGAGSTTTNRITIYEYDKIFGRVLERLKSLQDICEENKQRILGFIGHLRAKDISKPRMVKYINHLTVLARITGKPFQQLQKEDVERLVSQINNAGYSEHTKRDYKIILKKFYQWLKYCKEYEHEYPAEVKWIMTKAQTKRLLPEALLIIEEVKRLVEASENQRDRAPILAHYESGCRIGETLSLRILNCEIRPAWCSAHRGR